MSHQTYQTKWTECMQELMEQVQIEYLPAEAQESGQPFDPGFQHYALLYIKYLQIYKKLEDCHDQMVHPQKRRSIRKVLRSTIIRILELKKTLIDINPPPRRQNRFVALDEVLTDLRLKPETIEWTVPRYFLDDKECREEIEEKTERVDYYLKQLHYPTAPKSLTDKKDPFDMGLTTDEAVAIIQRNERGRRDINKADMVCQWKKESQRKEERQKRMAEKGDAVDNDLMENNKALAATRIAAHWKRKVDRRRFLAMREEEFEFLGMAPPKNDTKSHLIEDMKKHQDRRKKLQEHADDVYEKALQDQLELLKRNKGADIKADLLEERRQWILRVCSDTDSELKFPTEFDTGFYEQFDVDAKEEEPPPSGKDAKGGKKEEKKDDKAKKDKNAKKGKEAIKEDEPLLELGPTAVVQQFVERINEYTQMWEGKDESNNFDQRHDVQLAQDSVFPIVEAELRAVVDDMMREELANLKILFEGSKKGKKEKKKKPKKQKKGKKEKKWNPAMGSISDRKECVYDLVEIDILKKVEPCRLDDFWGEYHFLGAMQRANAKWCPPPSAQMVRSLIVEHCILPLAVTDIRQKAPEHLTARSLLLYGPKGSGKTMIARAIARETGATFFDLSPSAIEGKHNQGKTGSALLVYKVYLCAQDMAPSVVYIDNVEEVFQAKSKKKGGDANAPSRIKDYVCEAFVKQVKRGPDSTEQDRILLIGASSKPYEASVDRKKLMEFFDEKVWLSPPDYGSRVMLWQKFIEKHTKDVDPVKLNISTLAKVSDGYSAGSIRQTVDRVLTQRRVQQLKSRPLKVSEFLGPLSRTAYCWQEEYEKFRDFDHEVTGQAAAYAAMELEQEKAKEQEANTKKGK